MANQYLGEIRLFGGNFAPVGWAFCDGSIVPIDQNDALFALIGTTYGGDGQSTFALPDLRGRAPVHMGSTFPLGQQGGSETAGLTANQMPQHSHAFQAAAVAGSESSPAARMLARSTNVKLYTGAPGDATLNPAALGPAGGSVAHENRQPFLVVNFIIATSGVFPTQN